MSTSRPAGSGNALKILFSALHLAYFRNFESVIVDLAERGHDVHLIADEAEALGGQQLADRLAASSPRVRWDWAPAVARERWFPVAQKLRHALDYVRFLEPRYDASTKLRLRTEERAPRVLRWIAAAPGLRFTPLRRALAAVLMQLERLMPVSETATAFLRAEAPDVLLLTSMTYARAPQFDHQKAARTLGIPVGHCIMSWDHLSSKSLLHLVPDRMFVWNDVQKAEAIDMHPVAAERIVVTGAQCYDQWFDRSPHRSREEFCRAYGFDPSRPVILYVCSAMSPPPDPPEAVFVRAWIEALRASDDPRMRDAGILIRPHPERVKEWRDADLSGLRDVVVHGRNPIDADAKAEYFDALYYSAAVVGVCTTVFIEATIVGRPVLALIAPQFRMHQDEMRHFRYLVELEGGVLQTSERFDDHLRQLARALDGDSDLEERRARFLRAFLRPQGLDVEATPHLSTAIEALAAEHPAPPPDPAPWFAPMLAPVARHLVTHGGEGVTRWLLMDAIEIQRERGERRQMKEKLRQKRTRARNPKKQMARFKTQVKRVLGMS